MGARWLYRFAEPRSALLGRQVVEPQFESKDDDWIDWELGKRLGVIKSTDKPELPLKQLSFNQIVGAKVVKDDGKTFEPLVTMTESDVKALAEEGVVVKPQTGRVPIMEFREKGTFQIPRKPGDNLGNISLQAFRQDPVKNKLTTESGKIELSCQALAKYINGLGWTKIRPIPEYIPPIHGYESTFSDWEKKVKGEYPLQLFNKHYMRRSPFEFDNVLQFREAFPHEFFMNPIDAAERGIKPGDIVLVRSQYGKVHPPGHHHRTLDARRGNFASRRVGGNGRSNWHGQSRFGQLSRRWCPDR